MENEMVFAPSYTGCTWEEYWLCEDGQYHWKGNQQYAGYSEEELAYRIEHS
jgi:hypothetical protein